MIREPLVEYHSKLISSRERPLLDHRNNTPSRFDPRSRRSAVVASHVPALVVCNTSTSLGIASESNMRSTHSPFHLLRSRIVDGGIICGEFAIADFISIETGDPYSCNSTRLLGQRNRIFNQRRALLASFRNPLTGALYT